MINITQGGWIWDEMESIAHSPEPYVWHNPAERISALLGPDGGPLRIGYERPKIGFDLTPRSNRQ